MPDKQEQIQKSVDAVVDQILEANKTADQVAKAMPASTPANGGQDAIRSGSPMTEEQRLMEEKKKEEEAKKAKEQEEADAVAKAKKEEDEKKKKKDDDKDEDDKPAFMKKSIEELAAHLDEEELELVKAWREDKQAEEAAAPPIAKSQEAQPTLQEDIAKSFKKTLDEALEPLRKTLTEKDEIIKALNDKVEKIASQPAYDRRSVSNLETLEKSGSKEQVLSKSQVSEKMLQLQMAGEGVTSHHIAEFEATGNISDTLVKAKVFKALNIN